MTPYISSPQFLCHNIYVFITPPVTQYAGYPGGPKYMQQQQHHDNFENMQMVDEQLEHCGLTPATPTQCFWQIYGAHIVDIFTKTAFK